MEIPSDKNHHLDPVRSLEHLQLRQWNEICEAGYDQLIAFNAHRFTSLGDAEVEELQRGPLVVLGYVSDDLTSVYLGQQTSQPAGNGKRHFTTRLIPIGSRQADGIKPSFTNGYNQEDFLFFEEKLEEVNSFIVNNDVPYNLETGLFRA